MEKEYKIFKYENKFLKDKNFLSIIKLANKVDITTNDLDGKNVEKIFTDSILYEDGEIVTDFICKLKSGVYIYLSKEMPQSSNYELKIYYEQNQKNEILFLIKNLKKQKNGNS
jgi:hypothetical protein